MVNFKLNNKMRKGELINMSQAREKKLNPHKESRVGALSTELRELRVNKVI